MHVRVPRARIAGLASGGFSRSQTRTLLLLPRDRDLAAELLDVALVGRPHLADDSETYLLDPSQRAPMWPIGSRRLMRNRSWSCAEVVATRTLAALRSEKRPKNAGSLGGHHRSDWSRVIGVSKTAIITHHAGFNNGGGRTGTASIGQTGSSVKTARVV